MMRRVFAVILLVLMLLPGCTGKEEQPEGPAFIEKIRHSPAAKFEYRDSKTDGIIVSGEIFGLTSYFTSAIWEETDEAVTDWIYRITFNCKEMCINMEEVVVLIGENALSIDGTAYTTPEGASFSAVVDAMAAKYKYMGGT